MDFTTTKLEVYGQERREQYDEVIETLAAGKIIDDRYLFHLDKKWR